jgi:hypothetical protein
MSTFGVGNAVKILNLFCATRDIYDVMPRDPPFNFYDRLNRNPDIYLLLYNTNHIRDDLEETAKRNCLAEGLQQHLEEGRCA